MARSRASSSTMAPVSRAARVVWSSPVAAHRISGGHAAESAPLVADERMWTRMPPQASETTSERPQWERIAGQSCNAYEAFRRYRDAGSHRSIAGARSIERRWSSKWQWADRAGEWDSELYRGRT